MNLANISIVLGLAVVTVATWPWGLPIPLLAWWVWRRS
jgi:hypothetical protein